MGNHLDNPADGHAVASDKRRALVDAEYRLRTIQVQLDRLGEEAESLEGVNFSSIFAGLSGTRRERLMAVRAEMEKLQALFESTAESIESLRGEVDALERSAKAGQKSSSVDDGKLPIAKDGPRAHALTEAGALAEAGSEDDAREGVSGEASASDAVNNEAARPGEPPRVLAATRTPGPSEAQLAAAIEVCAEVRRDVRDEIEVAGSVMRPNQFRRFKLVSAVIKQTQRMIAGEGAERVRQSLRRLLRKLGEVTGGPGETNFEELAKLVAELNSFASGFSVDGFARGNDGPGSAYDLLTRLQIVEMHLEKAINDLHGRRPVS